MGSLLWFTWARDLALLELVCMKVEEFGGSSREGREFFKQNIKYIILVGIWRPKCQENCKDLNVLLMVFQGLEGIQGRMIHWFFYDNENPLSNVIVEV